MEHLEVFSGGEFNSFNGMYSNEEAYFNAHFVNNFSNIGSTNPMNLVGIHKSSMYSSDNVNVDMCSFSQGDSYENYYLSDAHHFLAMNNSSMPMECSLNKEMSSESMEQLSGNLPHTVLIDEKDFLKKRDVNEKQAEEKSAEGKISNPTEISKKRSRVSEEVQRKRNGECKNNKKCFSTNNYEEEEISLHRVSSSSFSSGDDSIASQELIGSANSNTSSKDTAILKLNGKPRASRGSATDPQSLYARKRRERINERLRTLQSLVPNGTKVDISTMLEEAVQYVKFLQLQIKLLSSDDLWMYAPIAYNGMDAGLDLNLNLPRW